MSSWPRSSSRLGALLDQAAQAVGERHAARVDPDERDRVELLVALDDLVRDPRECAAMASPSSRTRPPGLRRHAGASFSFPASLDRVKGNACPSRLANPPDGLPQRRGPSAFARVAGAATAGRVLVALVAVAVVWRAAAALEVEVPWIVPDEPAYALLGRGFWEHGSLSILGGPTPYLSVLYPVLAGMPLELGGLGTGYDVLRVLQAIVALLDGRGRLLLGALARAAVVGARRGGADAAAARARPTPGRSRPTCCSCRSRRSPRGTPVRALEAPTRAEPGAARRRRARLRPDARRRRSCSRSRCVAGAVVRGRCARARAGVDRVRGRRSSSGSRSAARSPLRSLGGYPDSAGYTPLRIVELVAEHAGLLVLVSGIVPLCAVVLLALTRPADPAVRSSLAVILALAVAAVLEVGVFAAGHADRLVERGLLFALPSLLVGFAAWLGQRRAAAALAHARRRGGGVRRADRAAGRSARRAGRAGRQPEPRAADPRLEPARLRPDRARGRRSPARCSSGCRAGSLWLLPVVLGAVFLAVSVSASREFADQSRVVQHTLVGDRARRDRPHGGRARRVPLRRRPRLEPAVAGGALEHAASAGDRRDGDARAGPAAAEPAAAARRRRRAAARRRQRAVGAGARRAGGHAARGPRARAQAGRRRRARARAVAGARRRRA